MRLCRRLYAALAAVVVVSLVAADASAAPLYVSNLNGTISKVAETGTVSTFATGFNAPYGLAFDGGGNLYAANYSGDTISRITPTGTVSTFATGLSRPTGLAFDEGGNLYAANNSSSTISRITPTGAVSTFATGLSGPTFITFAPVPEPGTAGVLAVAATGLLLRRQQRRASR